LVTELELIDEPEKHPATGSRTRTKRERMLVFMDLEILKFGYGLSAGGG
jgi:hypothetical protein